MMTIGRTAIILAAGLGQRMRPLTDTVPKPLINVAGQPLIAYAVDALRAAGVQQAVVNVHYRADQIESWAKTVANPRLVISDECAEILDTGGGILNALPLLGRDPFFVLNGDGFWLDGTTPALSNLAHFWRDADMDCLLLTVPLGRTTGFDGRGDFVADAEGRLARAPKDAENPVAYIGGYLVHPRIFAGVTQRKFSMNKLWDVAISEGRLFGLVHGGHWFHVGTPGAIAMAETRLQHLRHGS